MSCITDTQRVWRTVTMNVRFSVNGRSLMPTFKFDIRGHTDPNGRDAA